MRRRAIPATEKSVTNQILSARNQSRRQTDSLAGTDKFHEILFRI
jgi:hypothetical protein